MQSFLLTPHLSNPIWGFSFRFSAIEKQNTKWETNLCKKMGQTSSPPLKGGDGGDTPELEEELFGNLAKMCLFIPLFQPFKAIRVMMQFGYEPVSPYPIKGRGLVDRVMDRPESTCLYLPGIFGYSKGIVRNHGWGCLVAGLGPSLAQAIIDTFVEARFSRKIDTFLAEKLDYDFQNPTPGFDLKRVLFCGLKANIIQTISLIQTYPLLVVGNLGILRCIKGEPSVWIWSLFREVWEEAGFGGFYSGVLAMLVYQFLNVWLEEFLVEFMGFVINKINHPIERNTGIDFTLAHLLVTSFTYPFLLISNIMMVNKCSVRKNNKFEELPIFPSWSTCLKHMYRVGTWFQGSSVLQRRFHSVVV